MTVRSKAGTALLLAGALAVLALAFPGGSSAGLQQAFCGKALATIVGDPGDNDLFGTTHDDVIVAGAGRDEVHARAGDDIVCGGDGADTIVGGNDKDELHGDAGSDDIFGKAGTDLLDGDAQNDLCDGGKPTRPEHHPSDPDRATESCEQVVDALVIN